MSSANTRQRSAASQPGGHPPPASAGPAWPIHLAAWAPLLWTFLEARRAAAGFSVNPVQLLSQRTGLTALVLLVATLAVRPLSILTGRPGLLVRRRALGLYAFAWAFGHASITLWDFSWIEGAFDAQALRESVLEKPYALVGFSAFCLLLPLAITSSRAWMRRLGRRWALLNRAIYLVAPLVVLHYLWSVKADWRPPAAFGLVVALLLALRLPAARRRLAAWGRTRRAPRLESAVPRD